MTTLSLVTSGILKTKYLLIVWLILAKILGLRQRKHFETDSR